MRERVSGEKDVFVLGVGLRPCVPPGGRGEWKGARGSGVQRVMGLGSLSGLSLSLLTLASETAIASPRQQTSLLKSPRH